MRSFLPLQSLVLAMVMCCFLIPKSAAQNKHRTYTLQEISLDFSPWVQGKQGATLLLRSNLGKPSGQKWVKQNVLRGLFGFVQIQSTPEQTYRAWENAEETTTLRAQDRWVFAHIGLERQLQRKWFQVHFGGDVGYWQGERKARITQVFTDSDLFNYYSFYRGRTNYSQAQIALFSGLSVDLGSHFSIGSEFKVSLDFQFSKSNGVVSLSSPNGGGIFQMLSQNNGLRLLYLSYRF